MKSVEDVFNDYWINGGPTQETCKKCFIKLVNAFADAKLEEAARRAETHHFRAHLNTKPRECVCENQIADQIRALKHSAQTEGK